MKPILFNTEMVQAILDGRKTTTRRMIKPQPEPAGKAFGRALFFKGGLFCTEDTLSRESNYKPGDILYVQETWKIDSLLRDKPDYPMAIDFKALQSGYSQAEIMCSFTPERFQKFQKFYQKPGWQSPYFMPKEAARVFLRVTDVKAKQLHDITEEQIKQEGIEFVSGYNVRDIPLNTWDYFEMLFKRLWNSTVKKTDLDKYGWDANPWVWVIEFERCEKPKEKAGK